MRMLGNTVASLLAAALVAAPASSFAQEMGGPPMAASPAQFGGSQGGFEGVADGRDNLGTTLTGDTIVRYDAETDSIIVITDEATNSQISGLIERLDKPVPQVLIKVLFLEVTHNKDLDYGVEGTFKFGPSYQDSAVTDFGVAGAARGGFLKIIDDDINVTLRALATQGKLEVLSRPSVLSRNNEEASITIGKEVPFIRNSRVTDNGQTINTIEYEDIGIILSVTPHITPDNLVEMQVEPEISTLTSETVPITDTTDARVIAKRSASTRVVVADGKTVVIGGLMEDNMNESVNKVPLLGDIPLIGNLFSRTVREKSKTELLIFLTPTVVGGVNDLEAVTDEERNKLDLTPKAFKGVDMPDYLPPVEED